MSIQDFLFFIILPFITLMAALITWFHFKTRSRPWTSSVDVKSIDESISLNLTEHLIKDVKNRMKLMPFILLGVPLLIYVFVMAMLMLIEGIEAVNRMAFILLGLMIVGSALAYFSRINTIKQNSKALELAKNKKLIFQATNEGLSVPALMLTNPAFWRTTEKNFYVLHIPWSEIEKFEVWSGAGNAPAQYKIIPRDKMMEFAMGRIGSSNGPLFGICIKRKYIKDDENKILDLVHARIGERLVINTNL